MATTTAPTATGKSNHAGHQVRPATISSGPEARTSRMTIQAF